MVTRVWDVKTVGKTDCDGRFDGVVWRQLRPRWRRALKKQLRGHTSGHREC